jgi:hypothetical protein
MLTRTRQQACDLCFAKKIKCDKREPQCSNCKLYNKDCHRTISRSEAKTPGVPSAATSGKSGQGSRIESVFLVPYPVREH